LNLNVHPRQPATRCSSESDDERVYQSVLIVVVDHPALLDGRAGPTGRLSHRLHHPHQRDVDTRRRRRRSRAEEEEEGEEEEGGGGQEKKKKKKKKKEEEGRRRRRRRAEEEEG